MASITLSEPPSPACSTSIPLDIDSLCQRKPFITRLTEFLHEKDDAVALKYWIEEHENPSKFNSQDDVLNALNRRVSDIDHLINDQLNHLIHHPRFQMLEASWRGLWYLAIHADGIKNIKIKVLDITWKEVVRDIERAVEFDHSQLFDKIYSQEYGVPGGEPYGVIIGDYDISHRPSRKHPHNDLDTVKGLSEICAAAFSPFIAAASHELFGLNDFESLGQPINLHEVFQQEEYIYWRRIRDMTDSRFIGLTLPRILMRRPYQTKPGSYKGIFFYEKMSDQQQDYYLWGNAAYAFGAILIREFANVGWFGHIRGVPRNQMGGGLLTNLPIDSFDTDAPDIAFKPSINVVITDSSERELSELGFTPLCQCYNVPFAAFYSNQSIQKPKQQNKSDTAQEQTVNAKLSSMLQHVLCASRVAHYVKVMIRDKVGSFISAESCEDLLRRWLHKYTSGREDLEWEEQARYPLRDANVSVQEHPAKPGHYLCSIQIVPHYQVDQMVSELELVTELVQKK